MKRSQAGARAEELRGRIAHHARRYYVDQEIGAVVIICLFGGDSFGMLDTHMFRVENALIHYIHTLTVDGDQGSGTGW